MITAALKSEYDIADYQRLKVFQARGSSACRLSSSVTSRCRAVTAFALGHRLAAGGRLFLPAWPGGPRFPVVSPGVWRSSDMADGSGRVPAVG
jgi:hypothetical protein